MLNISLNNINIVTLTFSLGEATACIACDDPLGTVSAGSTMAEDCVSKFNILSLFYHKLQLYLQSFLMVGGACLGLVYRLYSDILYALASLEL